MSKTVHIGSPSQLSSVLSSSRVVVADFYADWCGPCKVVAPFYEQLSNQLSRPGQITFIKINSDTQPEISRTYNVSALPTFLIFKQGRETQRIRGADPKALEAALKNLAAEVSSSDASGSGSSGAGWSGASLPRGYEDVTASVDQQGLDFLNVSSSAGTSKTVFDSAQPGALSKSKGEQKKDYLLSDTDEQLMLFIPFQSTLKLHSIHLTSCISADESEIMRPKTVKIYANRSHVLGFDEAEGIEPTQTLTLEGSSWDSKTATAKLELRFVKFQNVTSVVLFVEDGDGDGEYTRLDRIRMVGETGEKRTMGKLEKIGDEQGE